MSDASIKPVRTAVIPAAGLGTRVWPLSLSTPKELLPVGFRPALDHIIAEAMAAGIEEFIIINSRKKPTLNEYYGEQSEKIASLKGKQDIIDRVLDGKPDPEKVRFVYQDEPKGLGHAVLCAKEAVGDEPFALLLPDMLIDSEPSCMQQMMNLYQQTGGNIIALSECDPQATKNYGIVSVEENSDMNEVLNITGMVEKPKPEDAPSNLYINGRYTLQPEIFGILESQKPGAGGEIQLTDAMLTLLKQSPFYGIAIDSTVYDCGSHEGLLIANIAYAMKNNPTLGERIKEVLKREERNLAL